jgi:hypothetical protein
MKIQPTEQQISQAERLQSKGLAALLYLSEGEG